MGYPARSVLVVPSMRAWAKRREQDSSTIRQSDDAAPATSGRASVVGQLTSDVRRL